MWSGLSLYHIPEYSLRKTGRSRQVSTLSRERIMKLHKYSKEQLIEAVKASTSMRQILLKLNVAPYGGNYDVLRKALQHFNLDTSHFKGQAWNKGKQLPRKRLLDDYLTNKIFIQSYKLRNRLLSDGIMERRCCNCELTTWQNLPIPLELDHINGNNQDNRLKNLRLLCPNCHALTPTYRSKNRAKA